MLNRRFGGSRGSILAKLVLGVVVAAIMSGCLEAVLRAAWWLSGSHIEVVSTLQNRNDPSEKHFVLPASVAKQLGTSQRFGVESNVLTYPDRDLLFHVRPNPAKADVYCYEGIDRFGYRNRDALQTLRSRPRLGTTRVLLLGDSCAFGWGICRFDETLGFQLEKLIGAPTHRAQVINLAQPGYSTEQGLRLFRRWFPKVRPDFVILYFGWNDLFPTPGLTDAEVLRLLPVTQSAPMRALMGTALYRTLAFGLSRMVEPSVAPGTSHRSRVPLEQSGANMRAMVEESRAGGAGVYIVVPPRGPQFNRPDLHIFEFNRAVREVIGDHATFIQPFAMDPAAPGSAAYFLSDGYHPSAPGARLLAEAIADVLPLLPAQDVPEMALEDNDIDAVTESAVEPSNPPADTPGISPEHEHPG